MQIYIDIAAVCEVPLPGIIWGHDLHATVLFINNGLIQDWILNLETQNILELLVLWKVLVVQLNGVETIDDLLQLVEQEIIERLNLVFDQLIPLVILEVLVNDLPCEVVDIFGLHLLNQL
jgi:hypothetical protein